ncbi:hypothetical protein LTS12_023200 [Elasticomyces elasticus]|nr:hypothetical protein LTS12_023200 [Elasticomyces elasticus]
MAPSMFQFAEHNRLLDIIDHMRSNGKGNYVSLPQLIVCGDQSAGKSSVLEAVSGVRFPSKDNLCTRFATELILRRSSRSNVTVAINPSDERSVEEKEALRSFKAPTSSIDDFPALVEAAKDAMGLSSPARAFSSDILRVEVSGSDQPNLTLVDLPGLFHAESKQQSANDKALVSSLVRKYMQHPRCIILAVVSARNDYANQIVTKMAKEVDPRGIRTLGIITKPDTLHVGSESEQAFLNLARNEEVSFRLGWHVLRNRDFDTKDWTTEQRNKAEADFFQAGVWKSLPITVLGVQALQPWLSELLKQQIVAELPGLIQDVDRSILDCRGRLDKLGQARSTIHQQRLYLIRISQAFSSLISAAINGTYVQGFFGDAMTELGFKKRLRAVAQDIFLQFAEDMKRKGQSEQIVEETASDDDKHVPSRVSRSNYLENVRRRINRSRGCEFPGTFNPLIIGELFYQQSRPWAGILDSVTDKLITAANDTIELALAQMSDGFTSDALMRHIINPSFEKYRKGFRQKISEILRPH